MEDRQITYGTATVSSLVGFLFGNIGTDGSCADSSFAGHSVVT